MADEPFEGGIEGVGATVVFWLEEAAHQLVHPLTELDRCPGEMLVARLSDRYHFSLVMCSGTTHHDPVKQCKILPPIQPHFGQEAVILI